MDREIESLQKRLKNGDEATLLPDIHLLQEDGETGPHLQMQACAISRNDTSEIPQSDYPQYQSFGAEWVVISGSSYQEALPLMGPNTSSIGGVDLVINQSDFFLTVTLIVNEIQN